MQPITTDVQPLSGFLVETSADLHAGNEGDGLAALDEVPNLGRGHLGIDGDTGGACLQDPEVGHAPLRLVLAHQHHVPARTGAERDQAGCSALRQGVHVCVGVALDGLLADELYGGSVGVVAGGGVEELDQIVVGVDAAAIFFELVLELVEDPLVQTGHLDLEPVLAPVEVFDLEAEDLALARGHPIVELADVVGPKDVISVVDEGDEEVDDRLDRACRLLHRLGTSGQLGKGSLQRAAWSSLHGAE